MKRERTELWLFKGRPRRNIKWAFRLFIASFTMLFVFSLLFSFGGINTARGAGIWVRSMFGPVPMPLVSYLVFFASMVWVAGWAILWGGKDSARPKEFVLGSWTIPLTIVHVWVSLSILFSLGVERSVACVIAFTPPLIITVIVPQLFVRDLLERRERSVAKLCLGLGIPSAVFWNIGTFIDATALQFFGVILPAYLGLLVIEYLSIHARINGPGF
jgi:hypothetical protein